MGSRGRIVDGGNVHNAGVAFLQELQPLHDGAMPMWLGGSPLPRIVVGAQRFVPRQAPIGVFLFPFHVAARSETPSGISPVVAMRQSAISSFLASATIIVLRVAPRASTDRARYHCASALSFWKMRRRQASWIMPRRTRALPALARPFSRRLLPLSSGAPVSPA